MRISKFLFLVFSLTFFACLYVWQQTKIFTLAYAVQKNEELFKDLLDKNSLLRYNLKKNTSLVRVGAKIPSSGDFQIPDNYFLVKLSLPKPERSEAKLVSVKKESLIARLFSIKTEVQAKTINP